MDNVVFKQSVMGFNRTQVLEYIDTLVKQLKDREDEYAQKQQEFQQKIQTLSTKGEETRQDLTLAVDKIKQLSVELEYFKNNNAELKNQIDHYKNLILTKDGELVNLKKETFSLKTRCELLSAENDDWKKRQDKIGETLIEAEMKAEQIIRQAEERAEETQRNMAAQASALSQNVVDLKGEIARVEQQLEQSFQKLQQAMAAMDSSAKTIEEQVDSYKAKIDAFDTSAPQPVKKEEKPVKAAAPKAKAVQADTYTLKAKPAKKTLTDSVLDTIAKILEK